MTILEEINEIKKEEVKILKRDFSLSRFSDSQFFSKHRIKFYEALTVENRISIISEIKKASPSKGIIKEEFNHLEIAEIYMDKNVDAISVLTDVQFFQGNISYLNDIAKIKTVPLLRKDFIIDEHQIYEAKANGADLILLIAESLSANQIEELTQAAMENDLEVLLELHSIEELPKINFNKNKIIGINNRDLKNFSVNLNSTIEIGKFIPNENLIVSESGIKTRLDIEFIKKTRASSILVGEHLMKSKNIGDAVLQLKDWCNFEN